jgi:hypothetical protein
MSKHTDMDHEAADRISAAADRDPDSATAQSGFDDRAQDAADRNYPDDDVD